LIIPKAGILFTLLSQDRQVDRTMLAGKGVDEMTEENCPSCKSFFKKTYMLFLACAILGAFAAIIIYTTSAASIEARDNITTKYNQCEAQLVYCQHPVLIFNNISNGTIR